jgi:hypothetical protein
MATVLMHLQDPVPMPRLFRPDLPEAVERVILRAMAKDPEDRFAHVLEMGRAYQAALAGKPVTWGERYSADTRSEAPSFEGPATKEAAAERAGGRSVGRLLAALAGIAALALAAFLVVPRLPGRARPGPTSAAPSALVATLAPGPIAASLATEAPPAQPTQTATPVVSAGSCEALSMVGFQRQASQVSWSVVNSGDVVHVANVEWSFSQDNRPKVYLGGELLVDTASVSSGDPVVVEAFEQAEIGSGDIRPLTISYPWAIEGAGHAIRLTFDNGCVLETDW